MYCQFSPNKKTQLKADILKEIFLKNSAKGIIRKSAFYNIISCDIDFWPFNVKLTLELNLDVISGSGVVV